MAVYKTTKEGNLLVIYKDDVMQGVPLNSSWCSITQFTDTHVVIKDNSKTTSKSVAIPFAEYYQDDGTTAIDNKTKAKDWLKDLIG